MPAGGAGRAVQGERHHVDCTRKKEMYKLTERELG